MKRERERVCCSACEKDIHCICDVSYKEVGGFDLLKVLEIFLDLFLNSHVTRIRSYSLNLYDFKMFNYFYKPNTFGNLEH